MAHFENLPYSNYHDLNLDWILNTLKKSVDEANAAKDYASNIKQLVDNFNVSAEVAKQINDMYADGRMQTLVNNSIAPDIILIGDSFGQGYTPGVTPGKGWTAWFKESYRLPCKIYDYSLDGACFLADSDRNFTTMLDVMANRSDINNDKIGYVIVIGGTNDALRDSLAGLPSRITNFYTKASTLFPRAKVILGYTSNITSYGSKSYSELKLNQLACLNKYKANYEGIGYIDDIDLVLLQPEYNIVSSDGVHPIQHGYELIGKYVAKYLLGGSCSYNSGYFYIPFRANTTYFNSASDVALTGVIVDDMLYLRLLINNTCKTSIPLDGNTPLGYYDIGSPIRGDIFNIVNKVPIAYWFLNDSIIKDKLIFPNFSNGSLTLWCDEPSPEGSQFTTNVWYARTGDQMAYTSGINLWLL